MLCPLASVETAVPAAIPKSSQATRLPLQLFPSFCIYSCLTPEKFVAARRDDQRPRRAYSPNPSACRGGVSRIDLKRRA